MEEVEVKIKGSWNKKAISIMWQDDLEKNKYYFEMPLKTGSYTYEIAVNNKWLEGSLTKVVD